MRKLIAAMNMSLDGFCNHEAMIADEEIHEHYNDLLRTGGILVYGRITYQLMESYWPGLVKKPSGRQPMDDFAVLIDDLPKLVFSHTLKNVVWKNSRLATGSVEEEILALKREPGKDILVGSPSLILATANLGLVDEFQLAVQPTILGKGLSLFKDIEQRIDLKLSKTKTFLCGAICLYYQPVRK